MKSNHFDDTINLIIEAKPCKHDNKLKTKYKTQKLSDFLRTIILIPFGGLFVALFYLFHII
jgi:hypothetical protein